MSSRCWGATTEINELNIGAAVFGRAQNYDPSVDGIVRSHASRLRQRLEQYFREEGAQESLRLSIPKGGYVPVFELTAPSQPVEEPAASAPMASVAAVSEQPVVIPEASNRRLLWVLSLALTLACAGIVYLLVAPHLRASGTQTATVKHLFWSGIFSDSTPTQVICSDTGLTILENLTGHNVSLADYLSGDYRSHASPPAGTTLEVTQVLAEHRYTSIVDTEIVTRLLRVASSSGADIEVRYARDIRPNALKAGSVVLLGTQEGNPWIELFDGQMNFRIEHNHQWGDFSVINRAPQAGELARYDSIRSDPAHKIYGLVALRPNIGGNGQVLILEGTSMAGTESAADFVFDDARLLPFLSRIRKADGSLPYFEVLLQSNNMNGNASGSEIVAFRTSSH